MANISLLDDQGYINDHTNHVEATMKWDIGGKFPRIVNGIPAPPGVSDIIINKAEILNRF